MLKYSEIKTFTEWDEEISKESLHDQNAIALEEQGHKVICLDRSLAIIEQCENLKESALEVNPSSLKVTVHPDKDVAPTDKPHEIFISANRFGSSDVVLKIGGKIFKANWVQSDS